MLKTLVVYNTSLCNLECRYCFLSKNDGLQVLDQELEQSFQDKNYYFNLAKKYCGENLINIESLEIWGGEPLLFLERVFPLIQKLIDYSPNFNTIMFSSNYTHDKVVLAFQDLMSLLKKYPTRNFNIISQISCDGPSDITDEARGNGVTEKILNNFNKLIENNYFLSDNVKLKINIKATLDITNFTKFLNKNYNIFYYSWFEEQFLQKVIDLKNQNITINYPKPNFAIPANYTQEDGKNLAKILKIQKEIEDSKILKYYTDISFFRPRRKIKFSNINFSFSGGYCGTGLNMIGLLPNGYACGCHRNFSTYIEDYIKNYEKGFSKDSSIVSGSNELLSNCLIFKNPEEFKIYQSKMSEYQRNKNDIYPATALISTYANQIRLLAQCDLIDSKYKDIEEATKISKYLLSMGSACITNNLITCSNPITQPNSYFKLFCNGATDYLFDLKE